MADKDFVVKNGLIVNTNLIVANGDSNRVGINNSSPDATLTVTGTANVSGNVSISGDLSTALLKVGANVSVNTSATLIGNSTANVVVKSTDISVSNASSKVRINPSSIVVGNGSVNVTVNATSFTGTANNSLNLGGTPAASYQLNSTLAANVATMTANNTSFVGTVAAANVVSNTQLSSNLANYQTTAGLSANVAKLTANNTSFVGTVAAANVVSNAQLSSNLSNYQAKTGNVALTNFTITSNATHNVAAFSSSNVSFSTNVLHVDSVNGRVGIKTATPDSALTVVGSANISSDLWIGGNFVVKGTITSTGTVTSNGDINPVANGYSLGNTSLRWNLVGIDASLSGNLSANIVTVSTTVNVGSNAVMNTSTVRIGNATVFSAFTRDKIETTGNVVAQDVYSFGNVTAVSVSANDRIVIGNSSVNATVNSTSFTGTANNATNLNGQPASFYTNATNLTTGTLAYERIPANVVNTTSAFTFTGVHTHNANVVLNTSGLSANGSYGSAGQVLHSNGTATYWATDDNTTYDLLAVANTTTNQGIIRLKNSSNSNDDILITGSAGITVSSNASHIIITGQNGDITSVVAGNGLTGGGTGGDVTLDVGAANGINVTADAIGVVQGTGVVVNATGVHVNSSYISSLTATFTANNTSFVGTVSAANVVSNSQLSSNLANYQTTAGLSANVATLSSNNSTYLNGQLASYYTNATNISSGTLNTARIAGSYTGITAVGTLKSLTVTANANFDSGTLFVDSVNNRVGVKNTAPSVSLHVTGDDAVLMPIGNTAQRPTGANGMIRYNSEINSFEGFINGSWGAVGGVSGGYYKGNDGAVGNTTSKANLFRINSNTQSNNIVIEAGENALTAGPLVIQDGFNLTINEGGRAVIV